MRLVESLDGEMIGTPKQLSFTTGRRDEFWSKNCVTRRSDTEFWRHCRDMEVPDSLTHKMELFAETGHIYREIDDIFRESSWAQVMIGQGLMPRAYHRMADKLSGAQLKQFMADVDALITKTVDPLPSHADFIAQNVGT